MSGDGGPRDTGPRDTRGGNPYGDSLPGDAIKQLVVLLAEGGTGEAEGDLISRVLSDDYVEAYRRETQTFGPVRGLFDYCCVNRFSRVFRFLVERGYLETSKLPNEDGNDFEKACRNCAWDIAALLLERGFRPGPAELQDALPEPSLVKTILGAGVPLAPFKRYKWEQDFVRSLVLCARRIRVGLLKPEKQLEVLKMLLERGATFENADEDGNTPLILSVKERAPHMVRALVEAGASLDRVNGKGQTALMAAAYLGEAESAKVLAKAGAALDVQDKDRQTAIWIAVNYFRKDIVRILVEAGANATIRDITGSTPADLARRRKLMDLVPLLEK